MTDAASCCFCGFTDTDHICLFCAVENKVTRHVTRGRKWRCEPCDERARLLGIRHAGFGMFIVERPLHLGIYGPPPFEEFTKDRPKLEDLYGNE